ncbi:MAG: FG-GAP repeat protein [Polyangiaceae bacterium]
MGKHLRVLLTLGLATLPAIACSSGEQTKSSSPDAGSGGSAGSGEGGTGNIITHTSGGTSSSDAAAGSSGKDANAGAAGDVGHLDASFDALSMCDPPPPMDSGCGDAGLVTVQQAYLKSDNGLPELELGRAVAIDGDTLVTGSVKYGEDGDRGAAFVYRRDCDGWQLQAVLRPGDAQPYADFGSSVAISGDTLVVGASRAINGTSTPSDGAAYVYRHCGSSWIQESRLQASNPDAGDLFGASVGISGDAIVVGAVQERSTATGVNGNSANNDAANAGAAYVFRRGSGTWTQEAYLKASNTGTNDLFGGAVAISGDTVVVGAIGEDSPATGVNGDDTDNSLGSAGAAYVFQRDSAGWAQQAYLKASNTHGNMSFGFSVAIDGDTLVVGALNETSNATGVDGDQSDGFTTKGAAYVFVRSSGMWSQQAYLKQSNTGDFDRFGTSVSISGDRIIVGAPEEDSAATGLDGDGASDAAEESGAAYVYTRSGTTWAFTTYVKASNTEAGDAFGTSVGISGAYFVVGAPLEDSGATRTNRDQSDNSADASGALYVFGR